MASTPVGAFYFANMSDSDPIQAIEAWQKWFRDNQVNQPLEKPMTKTDVKTMWMQKAQEHFADTLAEYQYELSGKDFYKAFYAAAHENMTHAKKEYDSAKDLVDMLKYHHLGQD